MKAISTIKKRRFAKRVIASKVRGIAASAGTVFALVVASSGLAQAQNCNVPTGVLPGLLPNLATGGGPAAGALISVLGTMNTAFLTQTNAFIGSSPSPAPDSMGGGAWIRGVGGYTDTTAGVVTNARSVAPAPAPQDLTVQSTCSVKTHLDYAGFQVGQDLARLNVGGWNLYGGVTGGYVESNVKDNGSGFKGNFQTPFVGIYAAATYGSFFIDGLVRWDFYQNLLTYPTGGLVDQAFNARAVSFSASTGYNWAIGTWFIEPSAGVVYSRLDADPIASAGAKYTDLTGADTPGTVSFNTIESLLGRVGLRVGTSMTLGSLIVQPFASASVWHEFAGNATASFITCVSCAFRGDQAPGVFIPVTHSGTVTTTRVGTYGQFAIGAAAQLPSTGWLGYARVDLKEGSDIEGVGINAGLRYQFNSTPNGGGVMVYKAPPAAFPQVNWTGFYVGGHTGAVAGGSSNWTSRDNSSRIGDDFGGFLGGVQGGYNYQINKWVIGVEGEYGWTNARGSGTGPNATDGTVFQAGVPPTPFAFGTTPICTTRIDLSCQVSIEAIASVTGRVGYTWQNALLYVKGGGAWMDSNDKTVDNNYQPAGVPLIAGLNVGPICHCVLASVHDSRWGFVVGAGFEYALSVNWSAKAEYTYMDFGSRNLTFSDNTRWSISDRFSEVKLGLNYRFASIDTVVAKY